MKKTAVIISMVILSICTSIVFSTMKVEPKHTINAEISKETSITYIPVNTLDDSILFSRGGFTLEPIPTITPTPTIIPTPTPIPIPTYKVPLTKELQLYIYEQCVFYEIPKSYKLIIAMIQLESNFDQNAVSSCGAIGLMQIMPSNLSWISEATGITTLKDAKQNIKGGVWLISTYLKKYDIHRALMSYNLGEGGAKKKINQGITSTWYSRTILEYRDQLKEN